MRMTLEIISWSISTKVWDRAGIKLAAPVSAVRLESVARHIINCTTRPGKRSNQIWIITELEIRMWNKKELELLFLNKTCIVGTQKNRLNYV